MSSSSRRREEEERIQLIKYQKIDEEKYDRENQIPFPADDASSYAPETKPDRSFYRIGGIFLIGLAFVAWFARSGAGEGAGTGVEILSPENTEIPLSDFDEQGRYIMRNYDTQKPMSSFLPGLGGIWGVPMWAFYVNRGQGITAFGVDNKDGAIAKYNSAEKAYQQTPFTGFRTFLKGQRNGKRWEQMPFFPSFECRDQVEREMRIGMNELEINERDQDKEIETNILYSTLPEEDFPGLVRQVTVKNMNHEDYLSIEILDGLMKLEPSGIPNGNLDSMGRTMEAWMNVYNVKEDESTQPFFHISQGTADAAQVQIIKFGHFVISYLEGVYYSNGTQAPTPRDIRSDDGDDDETKGTLGSGSTSTHTAEEEEYELLPFIVDPSIIFDTDTSLVYPNNFFSSSDGSGSGRGVDDLFHQSQGTTSRTPCAFTGTSLVIPPGGYMVLTSIYGHSNTLEEFLEVQSPKLRQKGYVEKKIQRARALVTEITSRVETNTSSAILNKYIQQNFLDNVLRGGLPLELGSGSSLSSALSSSSSSSSSSSVHLQSKIYHVYSRIHGDLERDYNFFNIDTTFFSQGPGNFRDVNQNRRIDVIHSPFVDDYNIKTFLSFVQADGYNPLTVASPLFIMSKESFEILFPYLGIVSSSASSSSSVDKKSTSKATSTEQKKKDFEAIVTKSFRLGQLLKDMKSKQIESDLDRDEFINRIVAMSRQSYAGQYAQNGYWTDHWTYTLDLIQSYLFIFPDREEKMMFDEGTIPFFMSPAIVKTRAQKYVLVDNPLVSDSTKGSVETTSVSQQTASVRVYNAVIAWGEKGFPKSRLDAMMRIFQDPNYVAGPEGTGGVWQKCQSGRTLTVSPLTKLTMLAILKFSTLDPLGMGVEMEGGKPGWNDAMNGLPGILGSEMSETYEMVQILRYVQSVLKKYPERVVSFPSEFYHFITALDESLSLHAKEEVTQGWSEEIEFHHWNRSNNAREAYRELMVAEPSCHTHLFTAETLRTFLMKIEQKTMKGIERALELSTQSGISPTYFYYDCVDYETRTFMDNLTSTMQTIVTPKKFSVHTLPLFLEGLTLPFCSPSTLPPTPLSYLCSPSPL
jgi:hypothetical protein